MFQKGYRNQLFLNLFESYIMKDRIFANAKDIQKNATKDPMKASEVQ